MKTNTAARIALVGIGTDGCGVVNEAFFGYPEADTIAIGNASCLKSVRADCKISISQSTTAVSGDGICDLNAENEAIINALKDHDVVFVASDIENGPLSFAIAKTACNFGCIVSSILFKPFSSESNAASDATHFFNLLNTCCASTVVVDNSKIYSLTHVSSEKEARDAIYSSAVSHIARTQEKIMASFESHVGKIAEFVPVPVPYSVELN